MTALTKDDGSYLKKWDEFGDLEGELLLTHAREVGALQYCRYEAESATEQCRCASCTSLRFCIGNAWMQKVMCPKSKSLLMLPDYLRDESLAFKEFVGGLRKDEEKEDEEIHTGRKMGRQKSKSYFKVFGF
jgi:hypothetical protein